MEKNIYRDLKISTEERALLHALAEQVAELSHRPIEEQKRGLWRKHNALQTTRPLVFCDPENGWQEIIRPADLTCQNELARHWETRLRMEIFWGRDMLDDRVILPFFEIPHAYHDSGWGLQETIIGGQNGNAYRWDAPLKDFAQIRQLHYPEVLIDEQQTNRQICLAQEIFGDVLPARLKTSWWWSLGMTRLLINLRGLTQVMYDISDQPGLVHQLLTFLCDGTQAWLDFLEKNSLLYLNNEGTYVGSGGFGWSHELPKSDFSGRVRLGDMWGFAESQETVGISPIMFEEFVFSYQKPILERFGLTCYGCCEPLDQRWEILSRLTNLRRVSISPWSNLRAMAEKLGNRYIFSMKPHPGDLAGETFDEERIRNNIRDSLHITRDCCVEIIMKDNNTIRNDPRRVIRWVKLVREEIEKL